jgi:hypothetical protein
MKSLNIKTLITVCLMATTTLISCKKDEKIEPQQPAPVVKTIEGSWIGKYGSGNSEPNTFFAFNIKADGVLEIKNEDNEVTGTGTWKLEEGTFTGTYKYTGLFIKYNVAAKYESEAGTLTGSWGLGDDTGSGEFYLNKQ